MEQFDWYGLLISLLLIFIIFSPLIFSKIEKNNIEYKGWKGLLKSKWFGIPLIFLLLFSYFSFLNLVVSVTFSIVVSFVISLIANTIAFLLIKMKSE
ncbi:hypothetical protein ACERII_05820 [Evansella sp. AB-rgal1]|uniref:hypothetical protein n=1 Tax=Evansella sp. AB-rgal1 TaxID=3242696 RepID=UPI00359CCE69